jgi:flagellar operon protein
MAEPIRIQPDRLNGTNPSIQRPAATTRTTQGPSFSQALAQASRAYAPPSTSAPQAETGVRFSNHAQKRLQTRDIQLSPENVNRLSDAIDKAEKRGGKSSLVMMDDMAFIVNVRDRLVVTALDAGHRGEGVFTQIDSVVFADPGQTGSLDRKG